MVQIKAVGISLLNKVFSLILLSNLGATFLSSNYNLSYDILIILLFIYLFFVFVLLIEHVSFSRKQIISFIGLFIIFVIHTIYILIFSIIF